MLLTALALIATLAHADLKQVGPVRVFDTTALDGGSYLNDHTLIQGDDGRWHVFGIYHKEPADPLHEIEFVHAVANETDPARWTPGIFTLNATAPIALRVEPSLGETHLWAPHVTRDPDTGRYLMVYQSGGADGDRAQIRLAASTDLDHWTRTSPGPLFEDICEARDPMLKKFGHNWVLYYTRCGDRSQRLSGVAYRVSSDLKTWSQPYMALILHDHPLGNSGFTESPFVFERDGWYYLSVTSYPVEYHASFVYRSKSPFWFSDVPVARLFSHAPEWIQTATGLFMTSAGWGQGGLDLYRILGM